MPELPEVETMRRGIARAAGAMITAVQRPRSPLRPIEIDPPLAKLRRRAVGRTIDSVGRLGKRIVLNLDSGDRLVIEPRMSGLVVLDNPPNSKHLRLVIELGNDSGRVREAKPAAENGAFCTESNGAGDVDSRAKRLRATHHSRGDSVLHAPYTAPEHILFWDQRGLGVVRLVSPEEYERIYGREKIGPDALEITAEDLRARLRRSQRPIKVALLDQKALAGVGNLYASEILHRAGVHPAKPCCRLRPAEWQRIHAEMLAVMEDAILHQGSTLRDGTYRINRDEPGNFQFRHRVYQRHGQPCLACSETEIVRIVQAQRSTFFCPACQR